MRSVLDFVAKAFDENLVADLFHLKASDFCLQVHGSTNEGFDLRGLELYILSDRNQPSSTSPQTLRRRPRSFSSDQISSADALASPI